jgi:tryptophan synthase alpha subunit
LTAIADPLADRLTTGDDLKLIPFLTAGYPDIPTSVDLARRLTLSGVAAIELGIPFSDPMADGPTIQHSSLTALRRGVTVARCLDIAHQVCDVGGAPVVLMGYFNPMLAYGIERFAADAAECGVRGVIVVDMPPEEAAHAMPALCQAGLHTIMLVTPTSSPERVARACALSSGYVYCVTVAGVTGSRRDLPPDLGDLIGEVRGWTNLPIACGFGLSTPEHMRFLHGRADAAVVGSAIINELREGRDPVALVDRLLIACREYTARRCMHAGGIPRQGVSVNAYIKGRQGLS